MTIPKLAQQLYFDTPKQEDEEVLFVEPVQDEEQVVKELDQQDVEQPTQAIPALAKELYFKEDQPSSDGISLSREIAYGTAQEMTALGSAFQITKAGLRSAFDSDLTYEEARAEGEAKRQTEISKDFPEFKNRPETLGVTTGRMAQALADPVTFFIPWAKAAKAGRIASLTTAGTFGATDIALRQEALYGEVTPAEIGMGFGLGVLGGAVGEAGISLYNRAVKSKVTVRNSKGINIDKDVVIPAATEMPTITPQNASAVNKTFQETYDKTIDVTENLGSLTTQLRDIGKRQKEIKDLRTKIENDFKTTVNRVNRDDELYDLQFNAYSKLKDTPVQKIQLEKETKLLKKQAKELDDKLFMIYTKDMPTNLLDVYETSVLTGFKNGALSENFARGLVSELVKPIFGGLTGFGVGSVLTGEDQGNNTALGFAAAGAMMMGFQKRIQSKEFKLIPTKLKDAMGEEFVSSLKRSRWNKLKSLTAASHVQDLLAWSNPTIAFNTKMYKMQGGGVKLGKVAKELGVEEEATLQLGYWKNRYAEMLSQNDDEVLILAGRLANERNLKSKQFSFLTPQDKVNPRFNEAYNLSLKIDTFTNDFKIYAQTRGLDFTEETQYGLTQILNRSAVNAENYTEVISKLQDAFYLQRVKELKISKESKELLSIKKIKELNEFDLAKFVLDKKEIKKNKVLKKLYKNAEITAGEYLKTSTRQRNNSIWAKEEKDAIFVSNDNVGRSRQQEFVLNAARHFDKDRTLYDQESRAIVSDLFIDDPLETLKALTDNTVKIAEFVKRFGAKGEGIKKLFKDIDLVYKRQADPKSKYKTPRDLYNKVPGIEAAANLEKQKIKDSLEAYFGVYGIESRLTSDGGQTAVMFLQTGLATTRLAKVSIPSMGDYLNTINNSGYKASFKSARDGFLTLPIAKSIPIIKKYSRKEKTFAKESLGLGIKRKQIDGKEYNILKPEGETILQKSLYTAKSGYYSLTGRKQVDNLIGREISDLILIDKQGKGLGKIQKGLTNFTKDFFEGVQLGRVTRISRTFAFQSGAHRAMDIANLVAKGKTKFFLQSREALQKEMDSLGLKPKDVRYLSQFEKLEDALQDQTARASLKKAGIKAADRDSLIPTVGNRRLFSQSQDPRVKFLGSFLSWAQAKTSQTNALIARVEDGDAALFLRIAASMPVYYSIREAQISLSSNKKYKEAVAEEDYLEKMSESFFYSGYGNLWVEKGRNMAKYDSTFFESIAPVTGFIEDLFEIVKTPIKLMTNDEAETLLEGIGATAKEISEVTPIVREFVPLLESEEEDKSDLKRGYTTGGLVEGEDTVPYTKEDPADRVNPYTGEPYQEQMDRLGFSNGGENIFSKLIDSIKEKVPASARLYYDKVIKQDKNPITEQDFTAKEYQEIKAHVKNTLMKDIKNGKIQFNNNGDAVYLRKTKDGRQATKPVISGYTKSDGSDGQIPSFTNVFGNASYALRNDSYKDAVLTIEDVYDFNFEYGGGFDSETKYKRGSNVSFNDETPFLIRDTKEKAGILNPINRSKYISALKQVEPLQVVKGNLNSLRPIAERYAAFRLPDEKTAEKLQQEYAPVNVAVGVPISEIFNEEEWKSFINTPKPVSLRQESPPERLGFDNGGETLSPDQKMYLTFYNMAREAGVAYPAAVAAQASLESSHGISKLAAEYNNPLGIKVNRPSEVAAGQKFVKMKTKEFENGKEIIREEPFRVYNNMAESFVGYKEKVSAPRYDAIRQAKNEDEYLTAIQDSYYASDPLYAEKTIGIKNRYANLIPKD